MIDVSVTGAVTVRKVEFVTVPEVALIVVTPEVSPVASPALLMDATALDDELHITVEVISCVVPSE